jgi:hypothetical protein
MEYLAQCRSCGTIHYVDLAQVVRGLSEFACPSCIALADYADAQRAKPELSQGTKDVWAAISAVAVVAGFCLFIKAVDHVLTA